MVLVVGEGDATLSYGQVMNLSTADNTLQLNLLVSSTENIKHNYAMAHMSFTGDTNPTQTFIWIR